LNDCFTRATLDSSGLSSRVCLSVRLSVRSRCCTETAKRKITQTTSRDKPRDSSFLMPKISAKFERVHPNEGAKCRWGRL